MGESEVRPGPPKLGAPHEETRRRGIASSGHASRRSAGFPPTPLRGPHLSAQSLPSFNPRHLFPRPARGPADGPRCLRAGVEPSLPPPPPAQVPARSRASLCFRLRRTRPTQSCTGRRNRRPGKGVHGGELWTLRLQARDRAWVTRGRSLRAAPPRWLKPRPLCSSWGCPQGPLAWRAAARELPAWKRRTRGH